MKLILCVSTIYIWVFSFWNFENWSFYFSI